MNHWLCMGWDCLTGSMHRPIVQETEAPAQRLEVDIPWLTALATLLVIAMSLCIGLSIVGTAALHMLD